MYPKNSIVRRIADEVMLEMAQSGIERKIFDKYFGYLSDIDCESVPFAPLGYEILLITFEILAIGILLAMILVVLELCIKRGLRCNQRIIN